MQNYIDFSGVSAAIGVVSFVAVFFIVRYIIQEYKDPENSTLTDNNIIGISIAASFVISLAALVSYKKYIVNADSHSLLRERFYDP